VLINQDIITEVFDIDDNSSENASAGHSAEEGSAYDPDKDASSWDDVEVGVDNIKTLMVIGKANKAKGKVASKATTSAKKVVSASVMLAKEDIITGKLYFLIEYGEEELTICWYRRYYCVCPSMLYDWSSMHGD